MRSRQGLGHCRLLPSPKPWGPRNEHPAYIIAPVLLTGNPVGVNGVRADEHASDHQSIGRRIKRPPVVVLLGNGHVNTRSLPRKKKAPTALLDAGASRNVAGR